MLDMLQFELIDGEFTTEEAREILMNLFSEKIRFHEVQILAKQERREFGIERHEDRIASLKECRDRIKLILGEVGDELDMIQLNAQLSLKINKHLTVK